MIRFFFCVIICFVAILFAGSAFAADSIKLSIDGIGQDASGASTRFLQIMAAITILSVAPSILMMTTCFTKIIIVFSILRNAIGLQQSPPNAVMTGLAVFITFFIMQPTFKESYDNGISSIISGKVDEMDGLEKAYGPFKSFMIHNTKEKELSLFANVANITLVTSDDAPAHVLIPAFMLSEIKRAFEIGFLLFIPFVVIDMIIASILMSMGMMMLPPAMIALPMKIIFFVLIDGWYLICGSLIKSYGI